jgi:DNA gyrase subunit A
MLNLKDMIHFVEHRHDVVTVERNLNCVKQRKSTYLEGLIIASDNIDEVIALIKASKILKKQEEN